MYNHKAILGSKLHDRVTDDALIPQKKPLEGPRNVKQQRSFWNLRKTTDFINEPKQDGVSDKFSQIAVTKWILDLLIKLIWPGLAEKYTNTNNQNLYQLICRFKRKKDGNTLLLDWQTCAQACHHTVWGQVTQATNAIISGEWWTGKNHVAFYRCLEKRQQYTISCLFL